MERNDGRPDLLRIWDGSTFETWSWDDWRERSLRFAAGLRALGVHPGERVACILVNSPAACSAVLGTWLSGGCLLSFPLPARGMQMERYLGQLRRLIAQAQPELLLVDRGVASGLQAADLGVRVIAFEDITGPRDFEPAYPSAETAVFVQYSSGSTNEPKGCVLSAGAIARQLEMSAAAVELDPERDVGVGWLPFSHDMGLFGALMLTYWNGRRLVQGTPERFLTQPWSWFQDCARFGATTGATPSFALALAGRTAELLGPEPVPMRRMIVGGERVNAPAIAQACEVLGGNRLPLSAVMPAYGLAEAVLAVTMTPLGSGPRFLNVDRGQATLAEQHGDEGAELSAATLVSAGPPLPGNTITIDGPDQFGEILVQGPTLASGYLDDPALTQSKFTPDGLRTGDIGFLHDDHLFIAGRVDDLMTIAGRNIYARDLEDCVSVIPGVRPGGCGIVDVPSGEGTRLVAVIEPTDHHPEFSVLAETILEQTRAVAGVGIDDFVFVPRGTLPKTPSGKVQRFRCREIAVESKDDTVVRVRA
jgi:fatty-acyl-CoA synthase